MRSVPVLVDLGAHCGRAAGFADAGVVIARVSGPAGQGRALGAAVRGYGSGWGFVQIRGDLVWGLQVGKVMNVS